MLISASRRTDIPACYASWFLHRVEAGFCETPNPFNRQQVSRISLQPQDVAGVVFWTRDPRPLLPHLDWLRGRGLDFHFMVTVVGYPRVYDPGTPPPEAVTAAMRRIAERFGPERLTWRYDPIFFSQACPPAYHVRQFARIAGMLRGTTQRVVVSLLEPYGKILPRLRRLQRLDGGCWGVLPPSAELLEHTVPGMQESAHKNGMMLQRCAQPDAGPGTLAAAGVLAGACLDGEFFQQRLGWPIAHSKDSGQRDHCLCSASRDIGMYESCPRGCVYCYAVTHFKGARKNWHLRNAESWAML